MTISFEEAVFGTKKKFLFVKKLLVIRVVGKVPNQELKRKHVHTVKVKAI